MSRIAATFAALAEQHKTRPPPELVVDAVRVFVAGIRSALDER